MTGERPVRRVDERRKEAAALFYFNRLRRRRAPLAAAAGCRSSTRPQLQAKTPTPNETNRGDGNQGLAMIESLVESAFSADTRLGTFLRSVTSKETAAWDVVPGKLGVFPCAPPVFPTPATTTRQARRAPRRVRLRAVERQLTGMIIAVLSFQVLGRPKTAPASCRMGNTRTTLQREAVASVGAQVRAFVRDAAAVKIDSGSGRKAESILTFLDSLAERELNAIYCSVDKPSNRKDERVRPIVPGRIDLPEKAGSFVNAAQYMPDQMAAAFKDPSLLEKADPPKPPRARMHCENFRGLLERYDEIEMLDFEIAAKLPADQVAGQFPHKKSEDVDRLISNRRPRNSQEEPLGASGQLFPHGSLFCEKQLLPGRKWRGSGDDLENMYHEFRVTKERALTNQFGPAVPFKSVAHLNAARRLEAAIGPIGGDTLVRGLQTTMPMGDLNATCFAEVAHLNLLRGHGACDLSDLASYRQPPPRGDMWEMLMVDDHVVTQDVPQHEDGVRFADDDVLDRSDAAYASEHLKPKESKRFRKETTFTAIGARVDGDRGWASSKLELILLAVAMSTGIAKTRKVTGSALTSAVSLWGHALLFRRAAWCYFDDVYYLVGRLGGSTDWVTVDRPVVDELLTVALLSPLLGTNLRAQVRSELLCTDARGGVFTGVGAVRADVRPEVARELYRHRTRRGGYARAETPEEVRHRERSEYLQKLLTARPDLAEALADDDDFDDIQAGPAGRWFGEVCKCVQWRRTFQYRSKGEPINRGELRAVRTAVRRLLRGGHFGVRQIIGVDSSVVEGVLAKGRSSSRELNLLLRSLAADVLVGDIHLGILPLASKDNPADEPSREKRVRTADPAAAPDWARRLVGGDITAIDCVLPADPRLQWCCSPRVDGPCCGRSTGVPKPREVP